VKIVFSQKRPALYAKGIQKAREDLRAVSGTPRAMHATSTPSVHSTSTVLAIFIRDRVLSAMRAEYEAFSATAMERSAIQRAAVERRRPAARALPKQRLPSTMCRALSRLTSGEPSARQISRESTAKSRTKIVTALTQNAAGPVSGADVTAK